MVSSVNVEILTPKKSTNLKPKQKRRMKQSTWIIYHLRGLGAGGDYVMNMLRAWNDYKSQTIGLTHKCSYASFRGTINCLKHEGKIEPIPEEEKTSADLDTGTMFQRSFYRLPAFSSEKLR